MQSRGVPTFFNQGFGLFNGYSVNITIYWHSKVYDFFVYHFDKVVDILVVRIKSITLWATSEVEEVPRRSLVRLPFAVVCAMPAIISLAASISPRCSNIMDADQICPIGFAIFFPAISGAEP